MPFVQFDDQWNRYQWKRGLISLEFLIRNKLVSHCWVDEYQILAFLVLAFLWSSSHSSSMNRIHDPWSFFQWITLLQVEALDSRVCFGPYCHARRNGFFFFDCTQLWPCSSCSVSRLPRVWQFGLSTIIFLSFLISLRIPRAPQPGPFPLLSFCSFWKWFRQDKGLDFIMDHISPKKVLSSPIFG